MRPIPRLLSHVCTCFYEPLHLLFESLNLTTCVSSKEILRRERVERMSVADGGSASNIADQWSVKLRDRDRERSPLARDRSETFSELCPSSHTYHFVSKFWLLLQEPSKLR